MLVFYVLFSFVCAVLTKFFIDILWVWVDKKKKLSQFESPDGHWLFGVTNIIAGDRRKSFLIVRKWLADYMKSGEGTVVLWFMHFPEIVIINHKDAESVISGAADTGKSLAYNGLTPWLGTGLLTSNGRKWHCRRKTLTPAFHFNILPHYVKVFNEKGKSLVEKLACHLNENIDIIPFISKFTFETICETAMGLSTNTMDSNIVEEYHKAILDMGEILVERFIHPWMFIELFYVLTPTYWRQRRIVHLLHKISRQVISLRKKQFEHFMNREGSTFVEYAERKTLSMLDILLLAQKENKNIDDEGIREEVDTFMFEGHDTTMMCLIFTLMLLANHKIHQDRIYEELLSTIGEEEQEFTFHQLNQLATMEMCIKESLRLYPSVPIVGRVVHNDVKLQSGKVIPSKTDCVIDFWTLHRDPTLYPNPELFDPDRFLSQNISQRNAFAYLPFSAGPRNCIGQKMAMLEVKCALAYILRNFILEPIDTQESIQFMWDAILRTSGPVKIKFVARTKI